MRKRNRTATPCGNLRGGELGDGLGALRDGVLGELAGEDEAHRGLDLPGGDGGLLVVAREAGGLLRELLEDVAGEGAREREGAFERERRPGEIKSKKKTREKIEI